MKLPQSDNDHLINGGFIAPYTWLVRKEYSINEMMEGEDSLFILSLEIWKQSKIKFLNQTTTNYRIHNSSVTHNRNLRNINKYIYGVFNIQKEYLKKTNIDKVIKDEIYSKKLQSLMYQAIALGNVSQINEIENYFKKNKLTLSKRIILNINKKISLKMLFFKYYRYKGYKVN